MTHHVVAHRDEQVEPQPATLLHLHLHGAAAFEDASRSDDEGEVVSPELRVILWRICVGVASGGQDGGDLDAGLQSLLPQCKALEVVETVSLGGTIDQCIFQQRHLHQIVPHCYRSFFSSSTILRVTFQLPGVQTFVMQ